MRVKLLPAIMMAFAGAATTGWAQFTQYAPPGSGAWREESTEDRLRKAMEQARWRWGPLRVEPWVGLGNLTYYDDMEPWREGKQSDYTASAGAGLTAFLPLGPRMLLAGYARPEYAWWKEYRNRNGWRDRYGAALFADIGRLSLEVRGSRSSQPWLLGLSDEIPIDIRRTGASLHTELRLLRRLYVFGVAEETRWRHRAEELQGAPLPSLATMDRNEGRTSAGLRYRFRDRLTVDVGYRRSETDFVVRDFDRSNSGSAPTFGLSFEGTRFTLAGEFSKFDLKPRSGSGFQPFEGRVGSARLGWKIGARSSARLYGSKSLAFVFGGNDYYVATNLGAALQFPLGRQVLGSLFAETATLSFQASGSEKRDVRSFGANASVPLWRRSALSLQWERRDHVPRGEEQKRRYDRFTASLNFGFGAAVTW